MEPDLLTIEGVGFKERELKLIALAKRYSELGAFGAPDHLFYTTVLKLALVVEKSKQFRSDHWNSQE